MRASSDNSSRRSRRPAVVAAAALAVALLAGCSGASSGGSTAGETPEPVSSGPAPLQPGRPGEPNKTGSVTLPADKWNEADAEFAARMIPHHQQALEMAQLAVDRAAGRQVKAIAERIYVEQGPEMELLEDWLTERGYAAPERSAAPDAHGHVAASDDMEGMATPAQMEALTAAEGREFDRMFLEMMIRHHEGALSMVEQWAGEGSEIRMQEIGSEINVTQIGEIRRMHDLLDEVGASS